jgi:glycine/D-amino acid oxidase-like deaminating enzyme
MNTGNTFDAIIIGGGFYGAIIALYLVRQRGLKQVLLVEQEKALLTRASYNNQARVHNGYHYPRSFTTAFRSRVNLPRFVADFPDAVKTDFTKLYAIARRNSKVTANQFERFCKEIGAKIELAAPSLQALFDSHFIERVFLVEEYVFDAAKLAYWAKTELEREGVHVRLETRAKQISTNQEQQLKTVIQHQQSKEEEVTSRYVFNCTYSGLNQLSGNFPGTQTRLKHEITEMALLKMPKLLQDLGITVMDGPFFSLMPFPARSLHTLSHVRYTPHLAWQDDPIIDPYQKLIEYDCQTRVERMIRDVSRFVPEVRKASYVDSLYEVKTVLVKNESDDGRPILFEKHPELPGCYSILGGKIDNIYDVLEKLEVERFEGY